MTPDEIEVLRLLVQSRSGVVIDPGRTYFIETCLAPIARQAGVASVSDLVAEIRHRREDRLMWAVTEALSGGDTCFFRDAEVFNRVQTDLLPSFAGRSPDKPVRIWSAACATGQEAYSLAMAVDEAQAVLAGAKIEIYASDLSQSQLDRARAGIYSQFEVQRGLPIRRLIRHFERQGETWRIAPSLMRMIRWSRINLLADLSPLGRFDVILCRNLLFRLAPEIRQRVIHQLLSLLPAEGILVIGADETIEDVAGLAPHAGAPGVYRYNRGQTAKAVAA